MRGVWLLVHMLGFAFWLGGGLAAMTAGIAAKHFAPAERLAVYRVLGSVFRVLVFWGVVGVTISGFPLLMPYMRAGAMPGWLLVMLLAGLVGALVALGVVVPTAARLARLELDARGELPEVFPGLRKRQVLAASIAGGLAIVAMMASTVFR